MLRLPDGMRERISDSAKSSGRTMNAEIVARLSRSFEQASETTHEVAKAHKSTAAVLGALSTTLAKMLLSASALFTSEQKKKLPQIGVWAAVAEGVVEGQGVAIVELLDELKSTGAHGAVDGPTQ